MTRRNPGKYQPDWIIIPLRKWGQILRHTPTVGKRHRGDYILSYTDVSIYSIISVVNSHIYIYIRVCVCVHALMCVVVSKHMGSWPMGSSRWFRSGGSVRPGPATAPASAHGTWRRGRHGRHGRWWRATASGTRCGDGAYIDAECRRSYILDVHPFKIYNCICKYEYIKNCQDMSRYFVLF